MQSWWMPSPTTLPHATPSHVRSMLIPQCSTSSRHMQCMMSMITELLLVHFKQPDWETKVPPLYHSQTWSILGSSLLRISYDNAVKLSARARHHSAGLISSQHGLVTTLQACCILVAATGSSPITGLGYTRRLYGELLARQHEYRSHRTRLYHRVDSSNVVSHTTTIGSRDWLLNGHYGEAGLPGLLHVIVAPLPHHPLPQRRPTARPRCPIPPCPAHES